MLNKWLINFYILFLYNLNNITEIGISSIDNAVKNLNYSLVYYYDDNCELCDQFEPIFLKLKTVLPNLNFFKVKNNQFYGRKLFLYDFPSLDLYVQNSNKRYFGKFKMNKIKKWIDKIFSYKMINKKKGYKNIIENDNIIIYYKGKDDQKINDLVKVLRPLEIYSESKYLSKIFPKEMKNNELYCLRNYDNTFLKININQTIKDSLSQIQKFEFPIIAYFNYQTFRWVFEYKLTSLIFFTKDRNHDFINTLEVIGKGYTDYFQILIIEDTNEYSKMLKEYLGVKESPELIIFKTNDEIKKYHFYEAFEDIELDTFLNSYVMKKYYPYTVNEILKENKDEKIKSINKKIYKKLFKSTEYYIIINYSDLFNNNDLFNFLEKISEKQKDVKFYKIDILKNDIEKIHYNMTPLILFTNKHNYFYYKGELFNELEFNNFIDEKKKLGEIRDKEIEKEKEEEKEKEKENKVKDDKKNDL